ncbi:protein-disulfide reductase DsbD domain-containing protein [Boseongicola aestuarii]|uniref:Thiol:disulfide interchange protein DsbD N-terminal domain-containing protein n=1 Tax=Boseongicola aestuarii TaxID=1470561 RepID=A0A238IZT9_9RHOB|nr:protein-disulfide reductase DsbD domain-containing protein [Boseongicola aestuarii]SMX23184.1 hypothetical protein BOA8489_01288 [Boseongicola aestuarii]
MKALTLPLAAMALAIQAPLAAAEIPDVLAQVEVLPGWRGDDGLHHAAFSIKLAPGWKTYWRAPGDAGIPPIFDWSKSGNLSGAGVSFPVPRVFYENGMRSIGYDDGMILPITLRATEAADDIELSGRMTIGVCYDICVPVELYFDALLPSTGTTPSPTVVRAMKDRPMTAAEAGVGSVSCDIEPIRDGMRITAIMDVPRMSDQDVAVIELDNREVWVSEPTMTRKGGTLVASADLVPPDAQPFVLARQDVRITVFGGGQAVDIRGCD